MENAPEIKSCAFKSWTLFLCGICMGIADLIPGISGGTIAFILGFYHPLLLNLKSLNRSAFEHLLRGRWEKFSSQVNWRFLLILLFGIGTAMICFANLFHYILEHQVYRVYLYSTFLGLILASFVFCLKQIKNWNKQIFFGLCLGAISAYILTEPQSVEMENLYAIEINNPSITENVINYHPENHLLTGLTIQVLKNLMSQGVLKDNTPIYNNEHLLVGLAGDFIIPSPSTFFNGWLVICGALAVSALLLPGISGSYILTLLGVYPIVIEALVDFTKGLVHFSFASTSFAILSSLGLGIIVGALLFARILTWILQRYPDQTLALLSGFMIGAIRSVWPFWTYEYMLQPLKLYKGPQLVMVEPYIPYFNSPMLWEAIVCAFLGFLFVYSLEKYSRKKQTFVINNRL